MSDEQKRTVVATFDNLEAAESALRDLGGRRSGVERGAILLRDRSGEVYVRDLDEKGLGDIARDGIDLTVFLLLGGAAIAIDAFVSSARLLLRSTGRAVDLTGSLVKAPVKAVSGVLMPDRSLEALGRALPPGGTAVVVETDGAKADEVRESLAEHGGRVGGE